MLRVDRMNGMNAIFLIATILTSVTGFMFPFPQTAAVAHSRRDLAGAPGVRGCRALRVPPERAVAQNLCRHSRARLVAECFRVRGAALHESARAAPACAHGIEPPFLITLDRGNDYFCRDDRSGGKKVSRRHGHTGLACPITERQGRHSGRFAPEVAVSAPSPASTFPAPRRIPPSTFC